ncbi:MAG: DNA-processing protein DprA [Candidatus Omnitrophota bacterium]
MAKKGSILFNFLNFGPKKANSFIDIFKDIDEVFKVQASDLSRVPFFEQKDIEAILNLRKSNVLDRELELIEKEKINCIDIFDQDYPSLLKEIASPPIVLYIKGRPQVLNKVLFAIVGTRIPTIYGVTTAESFAYRLSSLGLVIVSGLARGIDTAAHKGAIKTGETVAVLGSGLLRVYPRENKKLAEAIAQNGALVSEFPLFTEPLSLNFPRRNRIVSGLSKGILVVEAAARSGAGITARLAVEQNREVFAIPGNIDSPLSKGTHALIKEGAKLVECLDDILEELNIKSEGPEQEKLKPNLNLCEKKIFEAMNDRKEASLEEIFINCGLEHSIFNKTILELQLKDLIKEVKPACFVKSDFMK